MHPLEILEIFVIVANYGKASALMNLLQLNTITYAFRQRMKYAHTVKLMSARQEKQLVRSSSWLNDYYCFDKFYTYSLSIVPSRAQHVTWLIRKIYCDSSVCNPVSLHIVMKDIMVLSDAVIMNIMFRRFDRLKILTFDNDHYNYFNNFTIVLPHSLKECYVQCHTDFTLPAYIEKYYQIEGINVGLFNQSQTFSNLTHLKWNEHDLINYANAFPNLQKCTIFNLKHDLNVSHTVKFLSLINANKIDLQSFHHIKYLRIKKCDNIISLPTNLKHLCAKNEKFNWSCLPSSLVSLSLTCYRISNTHVERLCHLKKLCVKESCYDIDPFMTCHLPILNVIKAPAKLLNKLQYPSNVVKH